jgi:hypothetical protein
VRTPLPADVSQLAVRAVTAIATDEPRAYLLSVPWAPSAVGLVGREVSRATGVRDGGALPAAAEVLLRTLVSQRTTREVPDPAEEWAADVEWPPALQALVVAQAVATQLLIVPDSKRLRGPWLSGSVVLKLLAEAVGSIVRARYAWECMTSAAASLQPPVAAGGALDCELVRRWGVLGPAHLAAAFYVRVGVAERAAAAGSSHRGGGFLANPCTSEALRTRAAPF